MLRSIFGPGTIEFVQLMNLPDLRQEGVDLVLHRFLRQGGFMKPTDEGGNKGRLVRHETTLGGGDWHPRYGHRERMKWRKDHRRV